MAKRASRSASSSLATRVPARIYPSNAERGVTCGPCRDLARERAPDKIRQAHDRGQKNTGNLPAENEPEVIRRDRSAPPWASGVQITFVATDEAAEQRTCLVSF